MTRRITLSHLVLVCLVIVSMFAVSVVKASSPAEPAFKSQLRSCFENNRNTECLASQSSWYSCGSSVYSSYQLAVSISNNCMRSVCGSQNGLCCNTYCSMYGLSGYDQSVCFNKCFNPNSYSVASTAAAAASTLAVVVPFDDNSDFVPSSSTSDDKTVVKCSVSCDAVYSFYFANEAPSRKERNFLRALINQVNGGINGTDSGVNNGASTLRLKKKKVFMKSNFKIVKKGKGSKNTKTGKGRKVRKGGKGRKGKKISNYIQTTRDRIQVFDISLGKIVPLNPVFKSKLVGKQQICANTGKTAEVTYYKRSRVSCAKIQSWMKNVTEISPNNLLTVYKFMMLVYNKCRSFIPKKSKKCVVPMFRRINLNKDTLGNH